MSIAICPGSFDPITLGHLNIIRRTSKIFDEVVVVVMHNASKKSSYWFSEEERVDMIRRAVSRYANVKVESSDGLLADYAKKYEGAVIVKGLRASSDFEYEFQMNMANKKINPQLETMFITADGKYNFLSSSLVRELALYHADLKEFVPHELIDEIYERADLRREM